jgi:membrane protease YdiL (CAAX protease family)
MSTTDPSPSRTVLELLGLTAAIFLVSLVGGVAFVVPLIVLGYGIETTLVLVGSTVVGQGAMFGVGYLYSRYRSVSIPVSAPSLSNVGYAVLGVVVGIGLAIGLSALLSALGLLPGSVIGDTAAINPTYLLALAALSVVVVAPVEEFVFRGVVQGRLRQRFGSVAAIVGASLLFGSLHLGNYSGNPAAIVAGALMIAAIGTVFGALYELTDNLAVPVLAHAVYNVILLVSSYVAITAG